MTVASGVDGDARPGRPPPASGDAAAAALALAVFPADAPPVARSARTATRARRLPAAGAAAAPHVGGRPARVPAAPLRVGERCARDLDASSTSRPRQAAPARSCSSPCATRSRGRRRLAMNEEHDIVYRDAQRPGEPAPLPQRRRPTPLAARGVEPDAGAAVPLLGADLQRPPHPLRSPLRDQGRGLSRASSCTGR